MFPLLTGVGKYHTDDPKAIFNSTAPPPKNGVTISLVPLGISAFQKRIKQPSFTADIQ